MKRLLALLLLLSLTACGTAPAASSPEASIPEPELPAVVLPEEASEPDPAPEPPAIRTVDPSRPMVALTFDDGPHPEYTDQILDVLEEHGAVATFFEVAQRLSSAPDAVRRAAALGCEIGSHSYRHADLGKMSAANLQQDLDAADAAFIQVLGQAPTLLRPPYGSVSKTVKTLANRPLINWSVDPRDWDSRDADAVVAAVESQAKLDGQVILLHSVYESTVEAVRTLVPWLQEQGYQLVTVPELLVLRFGVQPEANQVYNFDYFSYNVPPLAETSSKMFVDRTLAKGSPAEDSPTVRLVMTKGELLSPADGGGSWSCRGSCEFQVWQGGRLLSAYPIEGPEGEDLLFPCDDFSLTFDDYNGDGLPDFSLGQSLSGNLMACTLFTLDRDGTIRPISEPFAIRAGHDGFSPQFEKTEGGFTTAFYDNAGGETRYVTYRWDEGAQQFFGEV